MTYLGAASSVGRLPGAACNPLKMTRSQRQCSEPQVLQHSTFKTRQRREELRGALTFQENEASPEWPNALRLPAMVRFGEG